MAEYAGQDASEAYLKSHGDDSARILKEHQHLRIGHIVTTRQPSEPPALDELIYDSLVYKLPETLSPGRKKAFGGKVIEEIMLKVERAYEGNRSQSLQSLWEHNDLCIELTQAKNCVARMKTDRKIRTIDSRELKACDGSEGEEWYNEGWAAINGDVYNLTCEFLSPHFQEISLTRVSCCSSWPSRPRQVAEAISGRRDRGFHARGLDQGTIPVPYRRQADGSPHLRHHGRPKLREAERWDYGVEQTQDR